MPARGDSDPGGAVVELVEEFVEGFLEEVGVEEGLGPVRAEAEGQGWRRWFACRR